MGATFLLLHGGQHGGWCWQRVEQLLQDAGHRTFAPDLPMDDAEAGARDWARHATSQVASGDGGVLVVAHSMGGLALPLVPELLRVRRLVALSALLPHPNMSFAEYCATAEGADALLLQSAPAEPGEEVRGAGTTWDTFRDFYVHDCTEADGRRAWERLRPRAVTAFLEPATITAWPSVPTTSIVMTGDRIVNPCWSRRVARRIGADVIDLAGGHSPYLASPELLAKTLAGLASC